MILLEIDAAGFSILELLPLVQSSDSALLLKVWITSKRKQLAYICQGSTAESLAGLFLLRRFRLAACVAFCRDGRDRGRRRAHKGPADAGGVPRILPNHDLGGAAGTVIPRQEHAVLHFDLVVERLEGPDVAAR